MTAVPSKVTTTRWSSTRTEDRFEVHRPDTGEVITEVQGAGPDEVDSTVLAANNAQKHWRKRPYAERARYLRQAGELIAEHREELARLLSAEMGKPYTQAYSFDLAACIGMFEFMGGVGVDLHGETHDSDCIIDITERVPFGVVAGIIPFNWPPIHASRKLAPALLMGNAVVLKPPEQDPLTVMRIVELVSSVLPDDVLHVVPGFGTATGSALTTHPLVRKICFTGSPTTGRAIMRSASQHIVPTLLELGGKNPLVIFADANVDAAVLAAVEGGFYNQGEACTAASRVLVQRELHDSFMARLVTAVARLKVGRGSDPATHVGPMVTQANQEKVLDYIRIGKEVDGANVALSGQVPNDPELANGFWVPPTIFDRVTPSMRIAQEEVFGPVIAVMTFDTEQEAIQIANGTEFGLVAGVFSGDTKRAMRVSREIEAGIVFVNHYNRATAGSPFGGTKASSGYGRGSGIEALKEFGYTRTLRIPSGAAEIPHWAALDE
ncbi:mitochondrial aldehyde dehydrogenase [Saitozyma podzolica]|uniref:Mitochondrial aldehyde dehydrogenase n=1 Tax=Saitozyma podzolica TaxID=1890683 RepID=A0A427XPM2_9TREE|nr:mitochondrial aldehyde dehydrogenase [Saitozyma podzolica]